MKKIPIRAGSASYQAWVGRDMLKDCGKAIAGLGGPKCVVIADENTAPLFADEVLGSLRRADLVPHSITIPAGEKAKTLAQAGAVADEMTGAGLDRTSFVVALGGGVVGDLAGFVAAIYQRGIPHVQIPTTVLAQVDSSIGGKTAVNTTQGKNLLGAFHQPALVIADVATLRTLLPREFNQGFAEIIKHAVIADGSLFDRLAQLNREDLSDLICRNIEIKAAVLARDAGDVSGERAILNFGHTVGHAIEHAGGYGTLLHGEAISLGIVAACEISVRKAGLPEADRQKTIAALETFHLPTKLPPDFPREKILAAVTADKKFERGAVRFVVSPHLGSAHLSKEVTLEDIQATIARL